MHPEALVRRGLPLYLVARRMVGWLAPRQHDQRTIAEVAAPLGLTVALG
jgi:hypothetical protein